VGLIQAKATHVVWPFRRWSRIQNKLPIDRGPISNKELEEIYNNDNENEKSRILNEKSTDNELTDKSDVHFTDYETMSDCGLLPGKFGPVS